MRIQTLWLVAAMMILQAKSMVLGASKIVLKGRLGRLPTRVLSTSSAGLGGDITKNFITNIIENDLQRGTYGGRVVTRFPPEPNGYLHLGHAKSINFNFAVAKAYHGVTHMRFDDTNPAKEEVEYINSILQDVKWLVKGDVDAKEVPWFGPVRHASDYFQTIYDSAEYLIKLGLAYVDELSAEEMKVYRGTLTEPGKDSPFRTRSVEENLRLFRAMKSGTFPDGHCTLRAKIDMASSNINLRDPALYRIKKEVHPITGSAWCIYPMYDFAHAISDALEGITHSLCTLEFENHRPLYDWIVDSLMPSGLLPYQKEGWRPRQYEFSRLNMQYTVLSKRKLITLVSQKHVESWDDPRLPTISALRRRGFPASAVRLFADRVGISKAENNIDISVLEDCAREVLDEAAPRLFAVTNPLKVTITNWEKSAPEMFSVERHPKRPELGHRELPFTGSIYIDRDDFFDTKTDLASAGFPLSPPKGYKRLLPQGQVRLKNAYVITCQKVVRDASGEVQELRCTYEPASRAGANAPGAAKVKGIIQWVSQATAVPVDLYLYDRLFLTPSPGKAQADGDFLQDLNPHSLQIVRGAMVEPSVLRSLQEVSEDAAVLPGSGMAPGTFQFERVGYFALDTKASVAAAAESGMRPRFNRVVTLKDTWQNAFAGADEGNTVAGQARVQNPASAAGGTGNPASTAAGVTAPVIEDVRRVELRVGEILSAAQHPDADTLYLLQVRVGDAAAETSNVGDKEAPSAVRTIISGLAGRIPLDSLPGRKVVVVCNLKPSKMRGIVSEGMLLAASAAGEADGAERVELLAPPTGAHVGELIRVSGYDAPVPDVVLKSKTAQEVWKRVAGELGTDAKGQAGYGKGGSLLVTSAGPCTVPSLANARIS